MELFYVIADAGCAKARRAVLELRLGRRVAFRNLYYPEVRADYQARGGEEVPALWDGERMHQGVDAVLEALRAAKRAVGG